MDAVKLKTRDEDSMTAVEILQAKTHANLPANLHADLPPPQKKVLSYDCVALKKAHSRKGARGE
jgi:hypothetical protein